MKKIILFFTLIIIGMTSAMAQVSFSCTYRQYCLWDDNAEEFDDCEGYEESSLFVINDDETMFTHTTETIKSTYYINERKYDKENEIWIYSVTSDVGNKYLFAFDPNYKEVRAFSFKDGKTLMIVFTVKAIF